jgi:hypothetical protein
MVFAHISGELGINVNIHVFAKQYQNHPYRYLSQSDGSEDPNHPNPSNAGVGLSDQMVYYKFLLGFIRIYYISFYIRPQIAKFVVCSAKRKYTNFMPLSQPTYPFIYSSFGSSAWEVVK